jgi:CheY-like chemotaxis protein
VKDLVTRHGGRVEARARPGQGSTFTVRLPTLHPSSIARVAEQPSAKPGRPAQVLIVDDNVDAAETLAMMLEILGQETRQATTVARRSRGRRIQPHVIFMDIGLPGSPASRPAAHPQGPRHDRRLSSRFAVMAPRRPRKSIAAGFDEHLVKPLDPGLLPQLLEGAGARRASYGRIVARTRLKGPRWL